MIDQTVFLFLENGLEHYFGMDTKAEILCVGHSHMMLGVDAKEVEKNLKIPVGKYAIAGANVLDRYWMIRHYINSHPSVKIVVYEIDARLFDSKGLSSASYTLLLPFIDSKIIDEYMKKEATWQEYTASSLVKCSRFRDQSLYMALRGLLGKVENKKYSTIRVEDYANYIEREKRRQILIEPEGVRVFEKSMEYLTSKKIIVVLAYIPVIDLLNDIDVRSQNKFLHIFKDKANTHSNIYFIDYNRDYQHHHELFYDLRHLNKNGNTIVTMRLITDLKRILYK